MELDRDEWIELQETSIPAFKKLINSQLRVIDADHGTHEICCGCGEFFPWRLLRNTGTYPEFPEFTCSACLYFGDHPLLTPSTRT